MKQCMLCGRESENDICPACKQEYNLSEPGETLQEETQAISSVWIDIGKALAWVLFAVSIIITLVYAFTSYKTLGYSAVLVVFGGTLGAFFLLSILLVFFDLAKDIKEIRSHLSKKK